MDLFRDRVSQVVGTLSHVHEIGKRVEPVDVFDFMMNNLLCLIILYSGSVLICSCVL